ncbi:MAG TPA: hypothetical protein DCE73_12620 [Paraprevotella xylaniphila]|jgi:hypothetical protein|uniref:NVEALA domain-containing protein n=1 Tax=Paraprevotella xylaniphila TaxID=454155 RepID=UPI000EEFECD3|nr:NVEALA domain-containing protein [Paraprevotella xylaniphila]HAC44020.1 hypothetical protein [Paraprevotella xylaniphila]
MKKRKLFNVVVGTVLGCSMVCVAYHVYDSQGSRKLEDSLLLENVEALATDDESGEDAAMKARREECYQKGGNWNEASHCVDSGFETFECEVAGEISAFGIVIKGSFKKGNKYSIAWARYQCEPSVGNCCTKQGLYSGDDKLA